MAPNCEGHSVQGRVQNSERSWQIRRKILRIREIKIQQEQVKIDCNRVITRLLQQNYNHHKLPSRQQCHAIATLCKDCTYWEVLIDMQPARHRIQHISLTQPQMASKYWVYTNTSIKGVTNWKTPGENIEKTLRCKNSN